VLEGVFQAFTELTYTTRSPSLVVPGNPPAVQAMRRAAKHGESPHALSVLLAVFQRHVGTEKLKRTRLKIGRRR